MFHGLVIEGLTTKFAVKPSITIKELKLQRKFGVVENDSDNNPKKAPEGTLQELCAILVDTLGFR